MRIVIELTEWMTEALTPLLLMIGTSDPTDNCECLYVSLNEAITLVFRLFA